MIGLSNFGIVHFKQHNCKLNGDRFCFMGPFQAQESTELQQRNIEAIKILTHFPSTNFADNMDYECIHTQKIK